MKIKTIFYVPTVDGNEIYSEKPDNDQRLEEDC